MVNTSYKHNLSFKIKGYNLPIFFISKKIYSKCVVHFKSDLTLLQSKRDIHFFLSAILNKKNMEYFRGESSLIQLTKNSPLIENQLKNSKPY